MPKTSIPKLRRQKGTHGNHRAYCILSGERVYLGAWGTPEVHQAFQRVLAEWAARGCKPAPPKNDASIVECCAIYTEYATGYFRANPLALNRVRLAMRPLIHLYGRIPAVDFGSVHLRAIRETMINEGLAIATINTRINVLRRMLRYCASLEMIPAETWHKTATLENLKPGRCAAKPPKKVAPVPMADIEAVEPYVTSSIQGLIRLQLITGARSGEVVQLKKSDIDTSGAVWVIELAQHKNSWRGHTRTLYVGPQGQSILKPFFLRRRDDEYLFQPSDYYQERSEAAPTHRRPNQIKNIPETDRTCGEHYTTASYRRAVERACVRAGVPTWTPHRLRHTRATELRRRFGIEAARVTLGHSNLSATEIYAEADAEVARKIAGEIG